MNLGIKTHLAPFFAPLRRCAKYFSTPRATNDYATHVPILIGLARLREIKNVLEFGCGHYSTLTFLNRAVFPHLERLTSVENDNAWAATLREVAQDDRRWSLKLTEGEIADFVRQLDLEAFDLILIDDSKNSTQRERTIRAVAHKQPQHPWIVIHDFEVQDYQRAGSAFRRRYRFKAYNPETGLMWNNGNGPNNVKSFDRVLKRGAKTLQPDNVESWRRLFL